MGVRGERGRARCPGTAESEAVFSGLFASVEVE